MKKQIFTYTNLAKFIISGVIAVSMYGVWQGLLNPSTQDAETASIEAVAPEVNGGTETNSSMGPGGTTSSGSVAATNQVAQVSPSFNMPTPPPQKRRQGAPGGPTAYVPQTPTTKPVPQREYTAEEERTMSPLELGYIGGEVLVRFKPEVSETQRKEIAKVISSTAGSKYELVNDDVFVLGINETNRVAEAIAQYAGLSGIVYMQKNYVYKSLPSITAPVTTISATSVNDPRYAEQWGWPVVKAAETWEFLESPAVAGYTKTRVVVLDTGMDVNHPDIQAALNKPLSVDATKAELPMLTRDIDYHGSHVGGIIAATGNNGVGVAGIASGTRNDIVDLVCVNVFVPYMNGVGASTSDIIRGLGYAKEVNARVVNMSLGTDIGAPYDLAYHTAVREVTNTGATVVVAHGNDNAVGVAYPADFDEVVSVIALAEFTTDNAINKNPRAEYSNYGSKSWISAPGSFILSLSPNDASYRLLSGTSMASPLVAGVVAMMYSVNPSLTSDEVKEILRDTALDLNGAGRDVETAYGCIDALRAVQYAANKDLTGKIPVLNSVNVMSASEMELSWRFMRGAEKCEIYRAEAENGPYTKITTLNISAETTTYRDTGLQDLKTYFYKIRFSRINDEGVEEFSEESAVISMMIPKDGKRVYLYNTGATGTALRAQGFLNLKDAVAAAQSGQIIELVSDIYLAETLTVSGNKTITLTAGAEAARMLKRDSSFSRALFEVTEGATLNFGNPAQPAGEQVLTFDGNTAVVASQSLIVVRITGSANIYAKAKFVNATSSFYGAAMNVVGTATMYGGEFSKNKVIDNNFTARGGAIAVYGPSGLFTMNGGLITENSAIASAWARGGGVYIEGDVNVANKQANGKFILNGGTISNNKAISDSSGGGGVEAFGGIFEMNGGTISGNHVREPNVYPTEYNGGGVELYGWDNYGVPSKFTMTGGEISGNDNGVALSMLSEMYLSGTAKIAANNGYGVSVSSGFLDVPGSGSTLFMSGGEVVNNIGSPGISLIGGSAYPSGGRARVVISGGTVSGNQNGGVLAYSGALLEVSGGTISGGANEWSQGVSVNASPFYLSNGIIDTMRFYNSPIIVNGDGTDPVTIVLNESFTDYNATMVSYQYPNASASENAAKAAAGKSRFKIKSPAVGLRQKASDPTKLEMDITIDATNVTLTPTLRNIHIGDKLQLTGTVTPATTTHLPVWTSSRQDVASVSASGEVRALKFGTTVITLAYGARKATATINVTVASDTNIGTRFFIGENLPATFNLPDLESRHPYWNKFPTQPMYNVEYSTVRTTGDLLWFPMSWGVRPTDFFTGELGVQNFSPDCYSNGAMLVDKTFLIAQMTRYVANEILPANESFTLSHDCTTGTNVNGVMLAALWRYGDASDLALVYGGTDATGLHRVYLVVGARGVGRGVVAVHTFPQGIDPRDTFHNYLLSYEHGGSNSGQLNFYVDGSRVNASPIAYVHAQEKNFMSYGFRLGGEGTVAGNGLVPNFTETRSAGAKVRGTKIYNFASSEYFALLVTAEVSGLQWRGGETSWSATDVWADWTSLATFASKDAFEGTQRGVMLRPSGNFSGETLHFDAAGYEPRFLFIETDRYPKNYVLSGTTLTKTEKIGASHGHLIINGKLGDTNGFNGSFFSGYSGGILHYVPPQGGNAATTEQILNGKISGGISLMKGGAGTLVLNAANDYSKGTLLDEGTLKIGHVNALGTGIVLLKNNTTLDLSAVNETVATTSVFLGAGETVSVKLGNRAFTTKKTLMKWNEIPEGNFTLVSSSVSGATLEKTAMGLRLTAPSLPDEPNVVDNVRTGTLTSNAAWTAVNWRDSAGKAIPADQWANANITATLTAPSRAVVTLDQNVTLGTLTLDGLAALQLPRNLFEQLTASAVKISANAQLIIASGGNFDFNTLSNIAAAMAKIQLKATGDAGTIVFQSSSGWAVLPQQSSWTSLASFSLHNEQADGIVIPDSYATTPLVIANLSGSKRFRADWNQVEGNRFVSVKQTANTTFSGIFEEATGNRRSALRVAATVSDATLTLSGASTTTGPLEISESGRVNLSGSWAGPVTVSGTLIATGTAPASLTLNSGSTLDLSTRTSTYGTTSNTVVVPAGVSTTIAVGNRSLRSGNVLLAWASIPSGEFVLSGNSVSGLLLEKTATGLVIATPEEPPAPDTPVLEVSPTTWQPADATAAQTTIAVTANNAWTAVSSDTTWLTVSPANGTTNGVLTLTVTENTGTSERRGTVTVRSGELLKTIAVTQPSPRKTATYLDFSSSVFNFTTPDAASKYMHIFSDGYFTVRSNHAWIRISNESSTSTLRLTFWVDENPGPARTGTLTVVAPGYRTREVTINQAAGAFSLPSAVGVSVTTGRWTTQPWNSPSTIPSDMWATASTMAVAVTNTTATATVTIDAATSIGAFTVVGTQPTTFVLQSPATFNAASYNFSAATDTTLRFSTAATAVTAGANTVLEQAGTGALTIATGKKATVPSWPANQVTGAGTLVLNAATADTVITATEKNDAFTGVTEVTRGVWTFNSGLAAVSSYYPSQSSVRVTSANAAINLTAKDATGWTNPKTLTLANGGRMLVTQRDSFNGTINFENGGRILLNGDAPNDGSSLDLFNTMRWNVTGATPAVVGGMTSTKDTATGDPIVSSGILCIRQDATIDVAANARMDIYAQWGIDKDGSVGKTLTKTGTGTLAFYRASPKQTGKTTVSAGTLALVNQGEVSSGEIALTAGTTLDVTTTNQYNKTLANVITGAGRLVKQGQGTLTLSGANTYTGGTTLSAGTLALVNQGNASSGGIALAAGTTLDVTTTDQYAKTISNVITGAGRLVKQGQGSLTLSGANTYTGGTTLSAGTLALVNQGNASSGGIALAAGTTLDVTTTDQYAKTISNAITGAGRLVKQGQGTLTLSGANTYTGGTTITAGTVKLSASGTFGTGTVTLTDGVTLNIAAKTSAFTQNITMPTNVTVTIDLTGTTRSLTGDTMLINWAQPPEGYFQLIGVSDKVLIKTNEGLLLKNNVVTVETPEDIVVPEDSKQVIVGHFPVHQNLPPVLEIKGKTSRQEHVPADIAAAAVKLFNIKPEFASNPERTKTIATVKYEFGITGITLGTGTATDTITLKVQALAGNGADAKPLAHQLLNGTLQVFPVVNGVTQTTPIVTKDTGLTFDANGEITIENIPLQEHTTFVVKAVE